MKTSELIGPALTWAVATALGYTIEIRPAGACGRPLYVLAAPPGQTPWTFYPSEYWADGGPIIEREHISITQFGGAWSASSYHQPATLGSTHLIAAMRCYVASKLGDEVDIPKELL